MVRQLKRRGTCGELDLVSSRTDVGGLLNEHVARRGQASRCHFGSSAVLVPGCIHCIRRIAWQAQRFRYS